MEQNWKVQLFELNYDEQERNAVSDVLKSGWITSGPKTKEFENSFSKYLGGDYFACAVSSCTAALHLALLASKIGKGDEVIIPALTFVAAANVVLNVGAKPVMADCTSYHDWNVSLKTIKLAISSKTKAVMIVHFAGAPCEEILLIKEYCKSENLILIEDVAHAPGASLGGRMCGTFGDFGCFSFFTNKNLAVGEGGMILSKSREAHEFVSRLRSHGMTVSTIDRYRGKSMSYDVAEPGLNYRIDELRSAIGLIQLEKQEKSNNIRKQLVQIYDKRLSSCKFLSKFAFVHNTHSIPIHHIYPILLDASIDRTKFITYLKSRGVQTSIHYPSMTSFNGLKSKIAGKNEIAHNISEREVTLPLHSNLNSADVNYICDCIEEFENVF